MKGVILERKGGKHARNTADEYEMRSRASCSRKGGEPMLQLTSVCVGGMEKGEK